MSNKTRYLQLNDVMMLEYIMKTDSKDAKNNEKLYFTKLLDNHFCVFSPNTYEISFMESGAKKAKSKNSREGEEHAIYNTMNHLAIPMDSKCNDWYTFIDNSYEYSERDELNSLKADEYMKYLKSPDNSDEKIVTLEVSAPLGYDEIRLYLVNGYDFSDMFGILCRIYVETDFIGAEKKVNPQYTDLCNFFFTKGTGYKMVKLLSEPVIFGNNIYDRYISIEVPSLHDICENNDNHDIGSQDINSYLHIRKNAPIHIDMASIEEGDYELHKIKAESMRDVVNNGPVLNKLVNCEFIRSSSLHGAIPTEKITSDRFGVYMSLNDEYKCVEFCCTWEDSYGNHKPLDFDTVSMFNNTIQLYDRNLIREHSRYEIDDEYTVDDSLAIRNWAVLHTLKISYVNENKESVKEEKYTMTQMFSEPNDDVIFYYRPFIKDSALLEAIHNGTVIIAYEVRVMNMRDMVQFINNATLDISPAKLAEYYINSVYISDFSNADVVKRLTPYKVYNKIVESKHEINKNWTPVSKIKYVKVFYNSTDVVLEGSNGTYYASNNIEISLSPVPKNYKFVIKNRKEDNAYDYMDLSDGYYKLYAKDSNNNDIVIEPTYSSNMNLLLGELEFSLTAETINALMNVDPEMRRMSIVSYNTDNSVSSLFDFTYNF